MRIQLDGLEELSRRLNELGRAGDITRDKAVEKGADYFKDKVQENVYSSGLKRRTGALKEAFIVSDVKDGVADVGITNKGDGFYGYFHEFGYYNKLVKKQVPARPFVAPTLEREKRNIERVMADEVKRGLRL